MKKTVKLKDIKQSKGKTDWGYLKGNLEPTSTDSKALPLTEFEISQLKKPAKV